LLTTPYAERRRRLADALAPARPPVYLTACTDDSALARTWFDQFEGAGLDGLVVKAHELQYQPGERLMQKVKHERTADCVLAGFRWHKSGPIVGSLLLGLYDDAGALQHVGVAASFPMARRKELVEELEPYRMADPDGHPWAEWASAQEAEPQRMPGATSRWNAGKDLSWQPLRPERVVEVRYDHMEGTRFRHTSHFVRWRPDRDPASCTYAQLEEPVRYDLAEVLQ
jgi:ATP-dependent DNA ligase